MTVANLARYTLAFIAIGRLASAQPPVRTLDVANTDHTRSVTLPLLEYNRLLDLAARPAAGPALAPIGGVVSSADLRIRIDRDTVRGVFALSGTVLRPGINRVPLIAGATLTEGSAQGRTLPLHFDGTVQAALLPGPGPFTVTLEWGAPLTLAPGRASFTLPVPLASTARATLDLPGDQADVRLSAGLITRRSSANGRTSVDVTLRPGSPTEVSWTMRDSAPVAAAREVRFVADIFSLVTLGDSDVRLASLVDLSIIAGEPRTIVMRLPAGYELTGISGGSLESSEPRDGSVALTVADPAVRRHQFLVTLERPHHDGSFALETGVPALPDAQRERGEIAVEGTGTFELNATEANVLHRIDVRELNAALQSLTRTPILAAFRYQRAPSAPAAMLAMDVKRFGDAGVLAAVADRAVATTLVTAEGRALTEIALTVQNRAQPFLKVALPPGATMVSVEVAGQAAKPVTAPDGTRVPLLRPGFRPNGPYAVSFVYMHSGTPFLKKGDRDMTLPKIDIPVGIVEWEIFVPEQYVARAVGGNVIEQIARKPIQMPTYRLVVGSDVADVAGLPGQIRGRVIDQAGAVIPGTDVEIVAGHYRRTVVTGADGTYVFSGVPSGTVTLTAHLIGFRTERREFNFNQQPRRVDVALRVGAVEESVTVTSESRAVRDRSADNEKDQKAEPPSQNVINLQRRTAGVLPVRVDVPRAGTSHQFVKPLVIDQETTVSLRYKRR